MADQLTHTRGTMVPSAVRNRCAVPLAAARPVTGATTQGFARPVLGAGSLVAASARSHTSAASSCSVNVTGVCTPNCQSVTRKVLALKPYSALVTVTRSPTCSGQACSLAG